MSTSRLMSWALELKVEWSIEKLVAIYCASNSGRLMEPGAAAFGMEVCTAELADWCGCSIPEADLALLQLPKRGVIVRRISPEQADGPDQYVVEFRDFFEAPAPVEPKEREIAIYVAVVGRAVKIGISATPETRIRTLQGASSQRIRPVFIARGPASVIQRIERQCHQDLELSRLHGEWFSCDPDAAVATVKLYLAEAGIVK